MQTAPLKIGMLIFASCVLAACSQGASTAPASATASPDPTSTAQTSADTGGKSALGDPCDVITATGMAGILTPPTKRESYPSQPECHYATHSAYVSIIVQPIGPDNEMAWKVATTYSHVDVPLPGIGDTALRNANGTTLAARKGDMFCRIEVVGYDSPTDDTVTKDRGETLARKLGALCTKLFAAH